MDPRRTALLRALCFPLAFAYGVVGACSDSEPDRPDQKDDPPLYISGAPDLTGHCITKWGDAYCAEHYGTTAPYCVKPEPACGGRARGGCVAEVAVPDCRSSCGYHMVEYGSDLAILRFPGLCADPDGESKELPFFWKAVLSWAAVFAIFLAVRKNTVAGLKKLFKRRQSTASSGLATTLPTPVVTSNLESQSAADDANTRVL